MGWVYPKQNATFDHVTDDEHFWATVFFRWKVAGSPVGYIFFRWGGALKVPGDNCLEDGLPVSG